MGIRTTQFIGLHNRADALLKQHKILLYTDKTVRVFPDGTSSTLPDKEVIGIESSDYDQYEGMFDEPWPLREYKLPDGTILQEFVQDDPWSSGPCVFTALRYKDGATIEETLWSDDEITEYA